MNRLRQILNWLRRIPPREAIVYTRDACGLCDEAVTLLKAEGFRVELVDIETDERLREKYGLHIPVVEIDGKVRFRGRIDVRLLRRLKP